MSMKRITSMPTMPSLLENRLQESPFPMYASKINDLEPLEEHKPYRTKLPTGMPICKTLYYTGTDEMQPTIEEDTNEPILESDYGHFLDHDEDIESITPSLTSSEGSTSPKPRHSRKTSALKRRSAYGTDDIIPLDFGRKEYNRVLPKPDLSQRMSDPTSQAKGMTRSGSRGMFRVSSEPVFVRPTFLDQYADDEQDLSSYKDMDQFEHSESLFKEGAMKKRISFGTIKIREHGRTLGDNPSCSYGAPIQLDWDHQDMEELTLDDYEDNLQGRRKKHEFHLNHFQRSNLLKLNGYSNSEINESKKQTKKIRGQRERTKIISQMYPQVGTIEDMVESGIRKVGKFRRSISKSKLNGSQDDLCLPDRPNQILEMMDRDASNATAPI